MNKLAAAARGELAADVVIHNAKIANVYTLEYEQSDLAIWGSTIAGIGTGYEGRTEIDACGRVLIPGLIDGHVHIEDTMMTPSAFALAVSARGTSSVMADPHEISNALGLAGLEYMFRASQGLPVDIFYGAPSCVPASQYETPYEELDMTAIKYMFERKYTQHLGEMMNYPAVISGEPEVWGKILAAGNVPLTGHAPGVTGKDLNAYLSSGIDSDHEATDLNEAREKLRRGMWLMIREGASFLDLRTLLPLIRENPLNASRCMVVSDDITARYIVERGHMDEKMRIMCAEGINPLIALRMITLSPAEYFRLYDRGGIAPGKLADFALLESDVIDENFCVKDVWKNGKKITISENLIQSEIAPSLSVRVKKIPSIEQIKIKPEGTIINVIGVTEGTVITKTLELPAKIENGYVVPDTENDIAKIVVLERHHDTGRFGVGFVKGLGIKSGAIASSVAHDAHNFLSAGADDASIIAALQELARLGGGLAAASRGNVEASFALPIGGLMNYLSPEQTSSELARMELAAEKIGVKMPHPFMVLSFLQLSVIPELRITDLGYVDITKGGIQKLFVR